MATTYSSLIGVAIGEKYEIQRVIAAGGMGVVCEALHRELGKRVAIKLIERSMKESEVIVARFRREARAAGKIQSEHIVDVFDVGADPRVGLYMVMEHLPGEDLQTRLDRDVRVDVTTAVTVAHHVARGLAKAHEAGVIHRDLKPANIFLTQRDSGELLVKLLDFGVSKLLGEESTSNALTAHGTPVGTPLYMSPEQAEARADVDVRADIWSLGAVLYEALSGTPPFSDRGSYGATLVGILTTKPKPLQQVAPWVPPAVASVVDAMLVHDREARLPSARAVTERLAEAFPAVRADGTGKNAAIIVPRDADAVDETGDTEFFSAEEMPRTQVLAPGHRPSSGPAQSRPNGDPAIPPGAAPAFKGSTVLLPRWSEIAHAAAAAAPRDPARSAPADARVPSEPPPPTIRDDRLALRAERRRAMKIIAIIIIVAAVGVAAFWAGRRVSTNTSRGAPTGVEAPSSAAGAVS